MLRHRGLRRMVALLVLPAALVAVGLSLRSVHPAALARQASTLSSGALLLAAGLALAQAALHVGRLWILFPANCRPSWLKVARAHTFGNLANLYLPGRTGEVVKVVSLTRPGPDGAAGSTTVDATGVVVVDKAVDLGVFGLIALLVGRTLLAGAVTAVLHRAWIVALGAVVLAGGAWLVRRLRPAAFARWRDGVRHARTAARELASPGRLLAAVGLGVLGWGAELGSMVVLSAALDLGLTPAQSLFGLVALNIGIAVPVSIGNVGSYEAATAAGLSRFGVGTAAGLLLGALHHVTQIVATLLPAAGFWLADRVRAYRRRPHGPAAVVVSWRPVATPRGRLRAALATASLRRAPADGAVA